MDFIRMFKNATPLILDGMLMTVEVSLAALAIGMVIGLCACLMSLSGSKLLKFISGAYIWIIRGTPMLVQAMIVYFGVPQVVNIILNAATDGSFERFTFSTTSAAIITLCLNAGAYLSEIFRSGIQAVPKGQAEAARSLGMTGFGTMLKVVLPQAFKIVIPSLVNQFIITIKDSSILSIIGLAEMVNKARVYVGASYQYFETYLFVAVCYLAITSVLMIAAKMIERKLKYAKKG